MGHFGPFLRMSGAGFFAYVVQPGGGSYHFGKQVRPVESTEILSVGEVLEKELDVDTKPLVKPKKA